MAPDDGAGHRRCARHGRPTLVGCATCERPICPQCTRWTEVGQKCDRCSGRGRSRYHRLSRAAPAAAIVGVLLVGLGVVRFLNSSAVQGGVASPTTTAPEVASAGIGEEVSDGGVAFVVTGLVCGEKLSGRGRDPRVALRDACVLDLTLRNRGAETVVFADARQQLIDGAGTRYGFDVEATLFRAGRGSDSGPIRLLSPGTEAHRVLVFAVPEGTVPVEAELHGDSTARRTLLRGPDRGARVRLDAARN